MQTNLQSFTNNVYERIGARTLTLREMKLDDLKDYQTGLARYKQSQLGELSNVREQIKRKESDKKKAPTTAEKATNWWAAMGIIFLCLSAIITGGAYSLSQIQQIQTEWIKLVLIIAVLGVGLLMFVAICKWIWPRRNINQFQQLFESQEN